MMEGEGGTCSEFPILMHRNPGKPFSMPPASVNETEAKNKLANYVYQYLCYNAPKTAEVFGTEVLNGASPPVGDSPGFLMNWWMVFWDLYISTPDRRDKETPTAEAKAFMEYSYSSVNGGVPPFPNQMGVGMGPNVGDYYRPQAPNASNQASPVPGAIPGYQGFSRYMPPRAQMPNQFPRAPFDPRMMHMQTNGTRMNFRPPYRPYMDSPSTPTFGNGMVNGAPISSTPSMMPSPGSSGPMPTDANNMPSQHFNIMMNPNLHPGQFSMMDNSAGTPTSSSAGPTSVPNMNGAPASVPNMGNPSSVGSGHHISASVGCQNDNQPGGHHNMMNGNEMDIKMEIKQSPSNMVGGVNGGTPQHVGPGSHLNNDPPSATQLHGPNSVQSQQGAANSNVNFGAQNTPQNAQMTPTSGGDTSTLIDFAGTNFHSEKGARTENEEISKIKASLIEDFKVLK
ncbi:unnamed protein product [Bursaphelenchus okinawaensis]|uniref:LisH domain-containing protein n=1 Tax=Bursaphelenchus okinawaensis TaxID=465554 RepID=A0A811K8G3_9BILA|nr:unnamed protein product [Bursaphelenchus okinawaensis]CAG9093968.1 unnamed protein product [Bursaphelenchus okinawaensis]